MKSEKTSFESVAPDGGDGLPTYGLPIGGFPRAIAPSQSLAARVAGVAYIVSFAIIVISTFAIHGSIDVEGSAAQIAANIVDAEPLYRLGVASDIVYAISVLVLFSALYAILKGVNQTLATLAAFLRFVYAITWVVIVINSFHVLRLLTVADYLQVFDLKAVQALASSYLSERLDTYYVGLVFYGLASTVCSYLFFRARYLPKALAIWGVIASAWCAACAIAYIIAPGFAKVVNIWLFDLPMLSFEIAAGFVLMIRGLGRLNSLRDSAQLRKSKTPTR